MEMMGYNYLMVICLMLLRWAPGSQSLRTVDSNFLGSYHRFNESAYYDWYYCCNTCGGTLQWLVNGEHAAYHTSQRSRLGDADFTTFTSDSNTVQHASILLSKRLNNTEICLDAILIVTQTETDGPPTVVCRSATEQLTVEYPIDPPPIPTQVNNGSVKLVYTGNYSDVVSPGSNFTTHFLVCASNGTHQSWEIDGRFRTGYHSINNVGQSRCNQHPYNSEVVMDASLLMQKSSNRYTSLFIYSDYNFNNNFDIECQSDNSFAMLAFSESTTEVLVTDEEATTIYADPTTIYAEPTSSGPNTLSQNTNLQYSTTSDVVSKSTSLLPGFTVFASMSILTNLVAL